MCFFIKLFIALKTTFCKNMKYEAPKIMNERIKPLYAIWLRFDVSHTDVIYKQSYDVI